MPLPGCWGDLQPGNTNRHRQEVAPISSSLQLEAWGKDTQQDKNAFLAPAHSWRKKKKRQPLPDINEHDCSRVHRKKILFSLQWWGGAPLPEPAGSTTLPPPANTEGMPGRVFSFGQHTWDQPEQFYRCFINWHLIHSSWKWCTSWTDRWATCSNGSIGLCFISLISQIQPKITPTESQENFSLKGKTDKRWTLRTD